MFDTLAANGSTDSFICHEDKLIATASQEVATVNGAVAIEEWVPGKGWVSRHSFSAVGNVVLDSKPQTKWRATSTGQTTGTWGVSLR